MHSFKVSTHVNRVNKLETLYGRSRFTCGLSYIALIHL